MQRKAILIIGLLVGIIFFFSLSLVVQVQAQSTDQAWTTPVNLSQSGGASDPQLVTSSDGRLHILWEDEFSGFVYTQGDGESLSTPVAAEFPFGREVFLANGNTSRIEYTPQLLADDLNRIHAFWVDDDNSLSYSRVNTDEFINIESWTVPLQLAEAVVAFDLTVGANGSLHLAYIRPISSAVFPAGVYYRKSNDGGNIWSNAVLLYESPYFRSLPRQQARINVETTASGEVIVAWDNVPEDRVFIVRSGDNGANWEEPIEIDSRKSNDLDTAVGPSKLSVINDGSIVHLFWQAGHESSLCSQYHQWSEDGGLTWQPPRRLLSEFEGCSQENSYVVVPGGIVLISVFESGVYSQFWDGTKWGETERHAVLSGFSNPSTFRLVDFGCRNFVVRNELVYVIGCDTSTNNDIWQLSTNLSNLTQVGSTADSLWSDPELVAVVETGQRFETPVLLADSDGRLHALWSQQTSSDAAVNYSVSEGSGWSDPLDVLTSPGNDSLAEDISAVYNPNGQLMVVWDNGSVGEVYFSKVAASLAGSAADWFAPRQLPAFHSRAASPDIVVDNDGRIYVAYALRLNEDRGIYLVTSEDGGEIWSEPRQIFDGVEAGWDAVDDPRITLTGDGVVHVMWTRNTLPPANEILATAYSASIDGGENWSPYEELPFADVPPVWSKIAGSGVQTVFRVWQEDVDNASNYWSQKSDDSGLTWNQPIRISDRNNPIGQADLILDGEGNPHLVELTGLDAEGQSTDNAAPIVQHWYWSGVEWILTEGFAVRPGSLTGINGLDGVVAANGNLVLLYSGLYLNVETGRLNPGYLSSSRALSAVPPTEASGPSITVTNTVTVSETLTGVESTPTPEPVVILPTPTVFFPQEQGSDGISLPIIGTISPFVAILPLGLIIVFVVLAGMRFVRNNRD